MPSTDIQTFRVHFADGTKLDVQAPDANAARKSARDRHDAPITKIKIVKEQG